MRVIAVPTRRYPLDDQANAQAALIVDDITAVTPAAVQAVGGDPEP
jgi:hypothetical protein